MADQALANRVYPEDESGTVTVTIASGQTTSEAFRAGAYSRVSLQFPAAFTGATVTFEAAQHQTDTFVALPATVVMVVAASTIVPAADFATLHGLAAVEWLKIVSASAEAADRTIVVHLKRM